jgi:hypothetical protein
MERLTPWLPGGPSADAATSAVGDLAKAQPILAPPLITSPPTVVRHALPPPIGMPPVRRPAPNSEKSLPDTKIDYPELPQVSGSFESSVTPPPFTLELTEDEDSSTLEMQIPEAHDWSRNLRPALLLTLLPLTLIGGALLIWGIIALFR